MVVLYDFTDNDHIPVSFNVSVGSLPAASEEVNSLSAQIKWENKLEADIKKYYRNTNEHLGKVKIPVSTMCCGETSCVDESHRLNTDNMFNDIISALQTSSEHLVSCSSNKYNKPGWSDYVSDLYDFSRET